jgi:hypothetical protein
VQLSTAIWVDHGALKSPGDNLAAFGRQMKNVFGTDVMNGTGTTPLS